MTSRSRSLILAFSLVGLAFASYSSWVHYRLLTDPTYISPCDINATFNCTQAYLSRYGSVRGVPVALGGVIWFALVGLIASMSRPSATKNPSDPTGGYIFALSTIGLAVVLFLGYASYVVLKTACVLCLGTYVSVIGIFIVSGMTSSVSMTRLPLRFLSDLRGLAGRPATLLVTLLFVAGAASVVAFFPKDGGAGQSTPAPVPAPAPQDQQQQFEQAWNQQPRVNLGIPAGNAKVVIVKFNDWLCPSCKAAHFAYFAILEKYEKTMPGAVKYIIKDYPLSNKCNFNLAGVVPGHEATCEAAAAVRLARDKGKGEEMIDWFFANQARTAEAIKAKVADALGITNFDSAYSGKIADIRRDAADGGALQVSSTPTFFINGVRAQTERGWLPPEYFDLAIQIELKKAAGK